MQGKVSMVMPCYNKEAYIGEMFDSILLQKWDNIELILVNDGSTDGTRDVITEYVPKFSNRGYDVIVVDQENLGVCAAAKSGLERITGDYVCVVDADDELDSEYVSTMAGWLEEHKEYDYAMCSPIRYTGGGANKRYLPFNPLPPIENPETLILQWFLSTIHTAIWPYIVRRSYFDRCKIVDNYYVDTKWSHEPSFAVPLMANKGYFRYFELPLYRFNVGNEGGHSRVKDKTYQFNYRENYTKMIMDAIERLDPDVTDEKQKNIFKKYVEFERRCRAANMLGRLCDLNTVRQVFDVFGRNNLLDSLIQKSLDTGSTTFLLSAYKDYLLKNKAVKDHSFNEPNKIIAYGVLGKNAKTMLPFLNNTSFEPDELWDIRGDGTTIKLPDFSSVKENDVVLLLPTKIGVLCEIGNELKKCSALRLYCFEQLHRIVSSMLYPELYEYINA